MTYQQNPGPLRSGLRRWRLPRFVRIAAGALAVLVLLPYALAPVYNFGQPVSTVMLWRWLTAQRVERRYVPIDSVAPALTLAVVAAEDGRFCDHSGVDLHEIREALAEADDLDGVRGGSTITQQVAKNLFLWPGRSFVRAELPRRFSSA